MYYNVISYLAHKYHMTAFSLYILMPLCSIEPKILVLGLCSQSNDICIFQFSSVAPGAKSMGPRSLILDIDGSNRVKGMTWFWLNMIEPLHNGQAYSFWMVTQENLATNSDYSFGRHPAGSNVQTVKLSTRGFSKLPKLALFVFSYCLNMRMSQN